MRRHHLHPSALRVPVPRSDQDWASRHVLAWWLSNTLDDALARHGPPEIFNTFASQNSSRMATTCIGFAEHPRASRRYRSHRHAERPRYGPLRLASFEPCEDEAVTV